MRIHNLSYILLLSFLLGGYAAQAQKISSSVLQSDNYQRDFPEPYYDSIQKKTIYPPYTDPKTGIVYEFQEIYADRDPYMGEYLYCYDDKIEPFGWSSDGKFYYAIHNYGYGEWDPLRGKIEYILIDVKDNKLIHYDTIENKSLLSEHNIKLEARLKQFPLIINNDSGTLLEKIDINNYLNENESEQKLTFSSIKKGEILIKSSEEIHDVDLGCPDEVKGYFLSPDKNYLIAVFYSNYIITGAGGDPCEGSIYLKVLDLEKFEAIEKDKSSDEVITRFWNPAHYDENRITEWLKNGYPYTISIDYLDLINGALSLDSLELLKDQIIIDGEGLGDPDDGRRWVTNMAKVYTSLAIISSGDQQSKYFQLALASSFINYDVNIMDFDVDNFMLYDYFSIIKLKLHLELKNAQNPKLTLLKIKEAVDFFDSEKGALLLQNMPEFKPDIDDFNTILMDLKDYYLYKHIKPDEKKILSHLLSDLSINKLDHALHTLHNTDKDWEIIQSFIELLAIKDSLDLVDEDSIYNSLDIENSADEAGYIIGCINFNPVYVGSYQYGWVIDSDFMEYAIKTKGTQDDNFFEVLTAANGEGSLYDNDRFGVWMAGATFVRTWLLGSGNFLNYFKKEAEFFENPSKNLSIDHNKYLKKIIDKIHVDAISYLYYDPRKESHMILEYSKEEVIKELNQIIEANVLNKIESGKLKEHIQDLGNDASEWKDWSLDNE